MNQERLAPTDRTALVTHRGCLDGTGSALMFVWAGGRRDRILFKNPSGLILKQEELWSDVDEVWYADCCPTDLTDPACGRSFRVFDHHVTNALKFDGDPRCVFDMKRSGTSLMAHVLGLGHQPMNSGVTDLDDEAVSRLVRALEAYDLGRFDEEAGVRLADIASSFSQEEMLDIMIALDPDLILEDRDLTARAEALSSVRNIYAEAAARSARRLTDFRPPGLDITCTAALAVAPVYWKNAVANELLKSVDLVIIFDPTAGMVSMRSTPAIDCSVIATAMGGGGHARASGFRAKSWDLLRALEQQVFG